jgi:thiamine phosphate synthase YjbQ (UPF0047 family)
MNSTPTQRGALTVLRESLAVSTGARHAILEVTTGVREAVRRAGVHNGLVIVSCLHTTCSVLVMDVGPSGLGNFRRMMGSVIGDVQPGGRNGARISHSEHSNASAALRARLLAHGVALGIADGDVVLDGAQAIVLVEWGGPRSRSLHIQFMGV